MQLSFDSISELDEFLGWAEQYRGHILTEPATAFAACALVPGVNALAPSAGDSPEPTCVSGSVGFDTPPTGDAKSADAAEPAKRKRRTKAEIEADAKETADALAAKDRNDVAAGLVEQPEGAQGANPFDQPANSAEAPAEGPETLNGDKKPAPTDEDGGETVATPFQHLTRAREFIAKHGMPKYNESFAKAGLDPNVMGYTAYQRGLHMEALTALEQA